MKFIVLGVLSMIALSQAAVVPPADFNQGAQPIVLLDPKLPIINSDNLREKFERIAPLIAPTLENLGERIRSVDQYVIRDIKERILTSLNNINEASKDEDVTIVIEPEVVDPLSEDVSLVQEPESVEASVEDVAVVQEPEVSGFEAIGQDLNIIDFDPNNIVNFVDEAPEVNEQVQVVDSLPEYVSLVQEPESVDTDVEDVVVVQEPEVPEFEAIGQDLNMIDFDPNSFVNVVNEVPSEDFVHVINPAVPFVSQIIIVSMPEQMVHQVHRFVDQVQIAEQPEVFQQPISGKQYDNPLLRSFKN